MHIAFVLSLLHTSYIDVKKVIIDKSRGEVSLLVQNTTENVSYPIKNNKKKETLFFSVLPISQNPAQISIPV
jgi:hypothetical protein